MTVEGYREDRVAELGEILGSVIRGTCEGIRNGETDNPSIVSRRPAGHG